MKKSTIKLIAMLMAVVLMLPNFTGAGALNENEVDDGLLTWEEVEEIGRLEAPATKAYEEIMDAWTDEQGNTVYPDTFGGCYLDDNHNLVVKVVDNDMDIKAQMTELIKSPSAIQFEEATISYNDLCELKNQTLRTIAESGIKECSVGISQKNNTVEVRIIDPIANSCSVLQELDESVNVTYVNPTLQIDEFISNDAEQEPIISNSINASVTVYPGTQISSQAGRGTVGWYGTYKFGNESKNCILTAGHVVKSFMESGTDIKYASTVVLAGRYAESRSYATYTYLNQGDYDTNIYSVGDYGFIAYSNNISPSNKLVIGFSDGDYKLREIRKCLSETSELIEGKTVVNVFKGYGETGFRAATIISLDTIEFIDNSISKQIRNVVSVKNVNERFAKRGDSGTAIYYINGSNEPVLCGIFSGGDEEPTTIASSYYYFTPMNIIIDAGFTPKLS